MEQAPIATVMALGSQVSAEKGGTGHAQRELRLNGFLPLSSPPKALFNVLLLNSRSKCSLPLCKADTAASTMALLCAVVCALNTGSFAPIMT